MLISNTTILIMNATLNTTIHEPNHPTKLLMEKIMRVLIIVIVSIIMMSLGCTMEFGVLKQHIKKPLSAIIGMILQFIVYPAVVFGLVHILQVKTSDALGMLLIATCPGGSFSNLITYWSDGDVVLSVCMTSFSTAIATGMMPLNLYLYTRSFTSTKLVIPYMKIVIALVLILVPVSVGMFLMRKFPKIAKIVINIGGTTGFIFILFVIGIQFYLYPQMFRADWKLWVAGLILPIFGLFVGYIGSMIACLNHVTCRTVAIEVSAQNVALCVTIIYMSFEVEEAVKIITFPCIYGVLNVISMLCVVLILRTIIYFNNKLKSDENGNDEETSMMNK